MPPVPNSSGGDFTIRSLSELSGTQTKHWPLDGLGSVINKKNGDNNSTSEEKADWCCFTDNTKTKAGWRGAALPRALFKGTNNEATRTTLKAAHSQSARECVQARQGEWKVVLFGVCVCARGGKGVLFWQLIVVPLGQMSAGWRKQTPMWRL